VTTSPAADLAFVATYVDAVTAPDAIEVMGLATGQGFTKEKIVEFVRDVYSGGATATQIVEMGNSLKPLVADDVLAVTKALRHDGLTGLQMCQTVGGIKRLGKNGTGIRDKILSMRGTLSAGATDITTPGGERRLTGAMILHQVGARIPAAPQPVPGATEAKLGHYPTGQQPAARSEAQLWQDCRTDLTLDHPGVPAVPETGTEKSIRQRLALGRILDLPDVVPAIAQQVFKFAEGSRPRPVKSAANEDVLAGGHTATRHIIGPGYTLKDLAWRVCWHTPFCPGKAGAFANAQAALTAMQAALDDIVDAAALPNSPGWHGLRSLLIRGGTPEGARTTAALGELMTIGGGGGPNGLYDHPADGPFKGAAKPANEGGKGGRPIYTAFPDFATLMAKHRATKPPLAGGGTFLRVPAVSQPAHLPPAPVTWLDYQGTHIPYEPGAPLATRTSAPTGTHLRILGLDVDGGWAIHSAWPV
jgi:hypothetical protein